MAIVKISYLTYSYASYRIDTSEAPIHSTSHHPAYITENQIVVFQAFTAVTM
jgi:hypothetical protein